MLSIGRASTIMSPAHGAQDSLRQSIWIPAMSIFSTIQPAEEVLKRTQRIVGDGNFVAGSFVADTPHSPFNLDAYRGAIEQIHHYGGVPIIFQSYGLTSQEPTAIVESYAKIGQHAPHFYAFELGKMFAPFGQIYDLDVYQGLPRYRAMYGGKTLITQP